MKSNLEKERLSVLVVDDEPFQRRILCEVLKKVGFPITVEAAAGELALREMKEQKFNLILSDVQMPGMNGLELLRRLRIGQTELPRDTRFIVVTSFSNTEVLGAAMALDVNGFLAKPIRIGVVMEKIARGVQEDFRPREPAQYETVITNLRSLEKDWRELDTGKPNAADRSGAGGTKEKTVAWTQLEAGMRVTRSLYATDKSLLIPAGTILTQVFINRLAELSGVLSDEPVHIAENE